MIGAGRAQAQEQRLHVLLSAEASAPTAAQVVEGFDFASGGSPPVAALVVGSPKAAEYLIPKRASGAFKDYLGTHPDSARARLERYIVVHYDTAANALDARQALLTDPDVEYVHAPLPVDLAAGSPSLLSGPLKLATLGQFASDWADAVNIADAWQIAGGWALVGTVDSGLATSHPDFVAFEGATYVDGNFLSALSFDAGNAGTAGCQQAGNCIESNVDEAQPIAVALGGACDTAGTGWATPSFAGHGSHVAGLVAANASNATIPRGACRHCGIAAWRIARDVCRLQTGLVGPAIDGEAIDAAVTLLADLGAQVINQSFNRAGLIDTNYCQANPLVSECLALTHAAMRGVLLVGASGNNRSSIAFPASQRAVVAAGGLGTDLALWNRDKDAAPNHLDGCPQPPAVQQLGNECGSSFTVNLGADKRQEVVLPAEGVLSTIYPGLNWNNALSCGDSFGGPSGDGIGECTGTSMAAPIMSGIAGILRSINPLVLPGDPENAIDASGIRDVVVATTHEARSGGAWNSRTGYGRPDAAAAAARMLGTVGGKPVRNRAIPLFTFYSTEATDHAATASPQAAMALAIASPWPWAARGPLISAYPSYPLPPDGTVPLPRASIYVLATEYRTAPTQPSIVPLFLLSRIRPSPPGCAPGAPGCNAANRDFTLVSSVAHLEAAVSDGYQLMGRQGYVFDRCTPEPACMPPGAERLYRQCSVSEDDCAIFLENERVIFEAGGYTASYPTGTSPVIGYAYPNVDIDADGLIDGFERLIGSNPVQADSDGDTVSDGAEYPLAGIPTSDPCSGPAVACSVAGVFGNGFE